MATIHHSPPSIQVPFPLDQEGVCSPFADDSDSDTGLGHKSYTYALDDPESGDSDVDDGTDEEEEEELARRVAEHYGTAAKKLQKVCDDDAWTPGTKRKKLAPGE